MSPLTTPCSAASSAKPTCTNATAPQPQADHELLGAHPGNLCAEDAPPGRKPADEVRTAPHVGGRPRNPHR
eukprot:527399-Alexandrium_andersonii.AAC.1